MSAKTFKTVKINLNNLVGRFDGQQRARLEQVIATISIAENAMPRTQRRLVLTAEQQWTEFLSRFSGTIGTRGTMSSLYNDVADAQKFMGRLLRETGCV